MGYIGMCGLKGYGFSAVLVINMVSTLAILVINGVRLLHSSLELGMCYLKLLLMALSIMMNKTLFIIIDKVINKSPSQIMFKAI